MLDTVPLTSAVLPAGRSSTITEMLTRPLSRPRAMLYRLANSGLMQLLLRALKYTLVLPYRLYGLSLALAATATSSRAARPSARRAVAGWVVMAGLLGRSLAQVINGGLRE